MCLVVTLFAAWSQPIVGDVEALIGRIESLRSELSDLRHWSQRMRASVDDLLAMPQPLGTFKRLMGMLESSGKSNDGVFSTQLARTL